MMVNGPALSRAALILFAFSAFQLVLVRSDNLFRRQITDHYERRGAGSESLHESLQLLRSLGAETKKYRGGTAAKPRMALQMMARSGAHDDLESDLRTYSEPEAPNLNTDRKTSYGHISRLPPAYLVGLGRSHSGTQIAKLISADSSANLFTGPGRRKRR